MALAEVRWSAFKFQISHSLARSLAPSRTLSGRGGRPLRHDVLEVEPLPVAQVLHLLTRGFRPIVRLDNYLIGATVLSTARASHLHGRARLHLLLGLSA